MYLIYTCDWRESSCWVTVENAACFDRLNVLLSLLYVSGLKKYINRNTTIIMTAIPRIEPLTPIPKAMFVWSLGESVTFKYEGVTGDKICSVGVFLEITIAQPSPLVSDSLASLISICFTLSLIKIQMSSRNTIQSGYIVWLCFRLGLKWLLSLLVLCFVILMMNHWSFNTWRI